MKLFVPSVLEVKPWAGNFQKVKISENHHTGNIISEIQWSVAEAECEHMSKTEHFCKSIFGH